MFKRFIANIKRILSPVSDKQSEKQIAEDKQLVEENKEELINHLDEVNKELLSILLEPADVVEPTSTRLYDPESKISIHFKVKEVEKSETALVQGYDNTIKCEEVLNNAAYLAQNILDGVRVKYGSFSPNSWFRCEDLERNLTTTAFPSWCKKNNRDVNNPESWTEYFNRKSHPRGEAADIRIEGVPTTELFTYIYENYLFDQLILEFVSRKDPYSGFVHVSLKKALNRRQVFSLGGDHHFKVIGGGKIV